MYKKRVCSGGWQGELGSCGCAGKGGLGEGGVCYSVVWKTGIQWLTCYSNI